jgi:ribosomal protein L12E/L44/L45/RPP1/RPP2
MNKNINEVYALAALFIHANNQQVTPDKMQAVFEALGLEYQRKIFSLYMLDPIEIEKLLKSSTEGATPAAQKAEGAAKAEDKPEAKPAEPEEEVEIDFDFF